MLYARTVYSLLEYCQCHHGAIVQGYVVETAESDEMVTMWSLSPQCGGRLYCCPYSWLQTALHLKCLVSWRVCYFGRIRHCDIWGDWCGAPCRGCSQCSLSVPGEVCLSSSIFWIIPPILAIGGANGSCSILLLSMVLHVVKYLQGRRQESGKSQKCITNPHSEYLSAVIGQWWHILCCHTPVLSYLASPSTVSSWHHLWYLS